MRDEFEIEDPITNEVFEDEDVDIGEDVDDLEDEEEENDLDGLDDEDL